MAQLSSKFHLHIKSSSHLGASPWSLTEKLLILAWSVVWSLFCAWTPKCFISLRLIFLKLFGCKIYGRPFVHQTVKIKIPWNVTLHDKCCIGEMVNLYSLSQVEVGAESIIAQEAYLCTGTHDLTHPHRPLLTGRIRIGKMAFIGARAFVMPGITIGDHAVVGACTVVTKNVDCYSAVAGNPGKTLKKNAM